MSITYYLLQISPVLLFALLVGLGAITAALFTRFFQKFVHITVLRAHNEVTGFSFLAIASIYGLLLSFITLVVWEQLNETRNTVSQEGSAAMSIYRDIKYYPDTLESNQLMRVYLDFVYNVVDDEFPKMVEMRTSRKTPMSFDKVFFQIEHLNPKTPYQLQLVGAMFSSLNDLANYRGLRITSMENEISPFLWLSILLGAILTLTCAALLDIEHERIHLFLNALLGAFIGIFFFVIIILDHPFSGSMNLKPTAYENIFTMEQWDNEAATLDSTSTQPQ